MEWFLVGCTVGWLASFVYGWNRRAHVEHKEFMRGYKVGKRANVMEEEK